MEGFIKKGIHLPDKDWIRARHAPIPTRRMLLPPNLRPETKDLPKDELRKMWVEERRRGIGASDAPIIMGTSSYKSPYALACEKMGLIPLDHEETEYQQFGHRMEALAGNMLVEVMVNGGTPVTVWDPQGIGVRHERLDFNIVSPDRFVMLEGKYPNQAGAVWVPMEIKNVGEYMKGEWGTATIPESYYDQVQDQMAAMGASVLLLVAIIGGNKFCPYTVMRDEKRIGIIEQRIDEFWQATLRGELPELDGDESTAAALKARYGKDDGSGMPLTDEARTWITKYLKAHARVGIFEDAMKAAKERKAHAGNWLRDFLGNAAVAEDDVFKLTWKTQEKMMRDTEAEAEDEEIQSIAIALKTAQEKLKRKVQLRVLLCNAKAQKKK